MNNMTDYKEIMDLEMKIFKYAAKYLGGNGAAKFHEEFEIAYINEHSVEWCDALSKGLMAIYLYDKKRLETKQKDLEKLVTENEKFV